MAADYKFGRPYVSVNPDPAKGPTVWRVAINDSIIPGGGGINNIDYIGNEPVEMEFTPGESPAPDSVITSLDFEQLEARG